MKMAKKIEKFLDKDYIQKIFQKKADFYFPRLKSKKYRILKLKESRRSGQRRPVSPGIK